MLQSHLFLFWLPLFASWLLMTLEGPFISATINRLPDEVIMLAAMGIVSSLSVTIESPIINLLATSTALSRDRNSYLLLRKFTIHWILILTVVTILLAFTPLFDIIVVQMMNVPEEIAYWVKPGLKIMTLWSAAIGWRRFLQGILIRYNLTRRVAWGTMIRLFSSLGTITLIAVLTDWPGVIIGSTALMAGVLAEAGYATLAVRPVLINQLEPETRTGNKVLMTYKDLVRFHAPLAATSLLTLFVQPLVTFSLARLPNPALSLAAWPVVFQVTLVSRSPAFALPEVVIAKYVDKSSFQPLRRFSVTLLLVNSLFMALFVLTPFIGTYLNTIQDLIPSVSNIARSGLILFVPFPGLSMLIALLRGLIINRGVTRIINLGMFLNLLITGLVLAIGIVRSWPGINTAAIALVTAATIELIYLLSQISRVLDYKFTFIQKPQKIVPG